MFRFVGFKDLGYRQFRIDLIDLYDQRFSYSTEQIVYDFIKSDPNRRAATSYFQLEHLDDYCFKSGSGRKLDRGPL